MSDTYGEYRSKFFRVTVPTGCPIWWEGTVAGGVRERFPLSWRDNPDTPAYFSSFRVPDEGLSDVERGVILVLKQLVPAKGVGHKLTSQMVLFKVPRVTRTLFRRATNLDLFCCLFRHFPFYAD